MMHFFWNQVRVFSQQACRSSSTFTLSRSSANIFTQATAARCGSAFFPVQSYTCVHLPQRQAHSCSKTVNHAGGTVADSSVDDNHGDGGVGSQSGVGFDVHIVPILEDNFSYVVMDRSTSEAALVDPADPEPVLAAASSLGANVTAVLTTHHHYDHDGGNAYVANAVPSVRVFGADDERIDARTHTVAHGQIIKLGALRISVMDTSCHTQHHLSYLVHSSHSSVPDACFTGDALFVGGCGRLFEGTPAELYSALKALTSTLPTDTLLYPGHEYTISNLVFGAAHACSDDIQTGAIMRALERAQALRARNLPTVPTTVAAELESNVFVRAPTVDHLAALRAAKDTFPGL